jgi:cytochrome c-type biogenesis protein CcmH
MREALLLLFVLLAPMSFAVEPDEQLADPALEARAREISLGLRCLVCQNQSIDDSNAALARDLRILVRQRLEKGDSDQEVRAYVVSRYGEFVLLRPPFNLSTLILWLTPALVLFAGATAAYLRWRGTPRREAEPLSEAEENALRLLVGEQAALPDPKAATPSNITRI